MDQVSKWVEELKINIMTIQVQGLIQMKNRNQLIVMEEVIGLVLLKDKLWQLANQNQIYQVQECILKVKTLDKVFPKLEWVKKQKKRQEMTCQAQDNMTIKMNYQNISHLLIKLENHQEDRLLIKTKLIYQDQEITMIQTNLVRILDLFQ